MFLRLFLVIGVSLAAPTQLCITHSCHSIRTSPALDSCAVSGLEMLCSHFTRTENSIRPTISSDGVYGSGQYLASYDTARLSPSIRQQPSGTLNASVSLSVRTDAFRYSVSSRTVPLMYTRPSAKLTVWFDYTNPFFPGDNLIHDFQKFFPLGFLLTVAVLDVCKCFLLHCPAPPLF